MIRPVSGAKISLAKFIDAREASGLLQLFTGVVAEGNWDSSDASDGILAIGRLENEDR